MICIGLFLVVNSILWNGFGTTDIRREMLYFEVLTASEKDRKQIFFHSLEI